MGCIVHGVAKSQTRLMTFTLSFHFSLWGIVWEQVSFSPFSCPCFKVPAATLHCRLKGLCRDFVWTPDSVFHSSGIL